MVNIQRVNIHRVNIQRKLGYDTLRQPCIPEQGVKLLGLLLAGSTDQHIDGRSKWAGLIYIG
jgi:hypothetical protein